ncbi:hypothetical protein [Methylobacterium sp. ID0610]|uniref:hypothetical protein n=1 Tax=Methylobacterium carpenticola TaxID=3344827 RepID=UPI0036937EFC
MTRTLNIPMQVVDAATGEVIEERTAEFRLMPPADPQACQTCGRRHPPEQPHDATRLHYQYSFRAEHGRWPTWADAVAHCAEPIREAWEAELRSRGLWPEAQS